MKFLIDFKNNVSQSEIDLYLTENNCVTLKTFNVFEKVYLVECPNNLPSSDSIESIINDESSDIAPSSFHIDSSFLNLDYTATNINLSLETDWWKNYSLYEPNFDSQEFTISRKGRNSLIYLLDGGINKTHPEFINSDIENIWSFTDNFNDYTGHGTAMASIMVGETCGMTSAKIINIKIFDPSTPTRQSDLLSALDTVWQHYQNFEHLVPIINCSWVIPKNLYIEQKIQTLIDLGFFVVASAGNQGLSIDLYTPASMKDVITIGSYGPNLTPSDFSNYKVESIISNTEQSVNTGEIDGWAPGESIRAAYLNDSYGIINGTSASAAIVSSGLAYNMDTHNFSNHSDVNIDWIWRGYGKKIMTRTLGRPTLLDLTERYRFCNSHIATFDNFIPQDRVFEPLYKIVLSKRTLEKDLLYWQPLFNINNFKSLTFDKNLLNGMEVSPSGYLLINQEILLPNDNSYRVEEFNYTVVDQEDEIFTGKIELHIFGKDTQDEDLSAIEGLDPMLLIQAQGTNYWCAFGGYCTVLAYQNDTCYDNCASYSPWALCNNGICKGLYVGVGNEEPSDCQCS